MKISLDYDDTYTRDPLLWNWFVAQALERGHDVYCVTARNPSQLDEVEFTLGRVLLPGHIIATSQQPKRPFVNQMGVTIDVWIDDMPEMIGEVQLLRGLKP